MENILKNKHFLCSIKLYFTRRLGELSRKGQLKNRIYPMFDDETYEQIKKVAAKKNCTMAEVVRDFTIQGLNAEVTKNNIDFISSIIREQMQISMKGYIERLAALEAKTCMAAASSMYLNLEALQKMVPKTERTDVQNSYAKARKKAHEYTQGKRGDAS